MAILNSTVVNGSLNITNDTDASNGTLKINKINAPTSSGGITYGPGSSGQVLKSNGTSMYWASDNNTNTVRQIKVNGTSVLSTSSTTTALDFVAGSGITLAESGGALTISSSGSGSVSNFYSTSYTFDANGTPIYLMNLLENSGNGMGKVIISISNSTIAISDDVSPISDVKYAELYFSGYVLVGGFYIDSSSNTNDLVSSGFGGSYDVFNMYDDNYIGTITATIIWIGDF